MTVGQLIAKFGTCHTPIANMASPARKQGFSVVTVAKANSSLICFAEASTFARCWLFMCSINSSKLVRKEVSIRSRSQEKLRKVLFILSKYAR